MRDNKELQNLTTEELGILFPIHIVPYDGKWKSIFNKEADLIKKSLGPEIALRAEHFGSTAIAGLSSKPVIDILVEIPPLTEELKEIVIQIMSQLEYTFIWRTDDPVPYMNFVKGYAITGFQGQIFHIHMGDKTHSLWDRLFFRDYLILKPEVAREYEQLKITLAEIYKYDRDGYTKGKEEYVNRVTKIAKNEIGNR